MKSTVGMKRFVLNYFEVAISAPFVAERLSVSSAQEQRY